MVANLSWREASFIKFLISSTYIRNQAIPIANITFLADKGKVDFIKVWMSLPDDLESIIDSQGLYNLESLWILKQEENYFTSEWAYSFADKYTELLKKSNPSYNEDKNIYKINKAIFSITPFGLTFLNVFKDIDKWTQ
jgi:hypothetical protein